MAKIKNFKLTGICFVLFLFGLGSAAAAELFEFSPMWYPVEHGWEADGNLTGITVQPGAELIIRDRSTTSHLGFFHRMTSDAEGLEARLRIIATDNVTAEADGDTGVGVGMSLGVHGFHVRLVQAADRRVCIVLDGGGLSHGIAGVDWMAETGVALRRVVHLDQEMAELTVTRPDGTTEVERVPVTDLPPHHRATPSVEFGCFSDSAEVSAAIKSVGGAPEAEANVHVFITTEEQQTTLIQGTASDADGDSLTYRWREAELDLTGWQAVGANGEADLDLSTLPLFAAGQHVLMLEVSDGKFISSDLMILTISNTAPYAAPSGGGVYSLFVSVHLECEVIDFDGDTLTYEWKEGDNTLCTGSVETLAGGEALWLPECILEPGIGTHTYRLSVNDGTNEPVSAMVEVTVIDVAEIAPTIAPIISRNILWPPNHQMVDLTISAFAEDNSGWPLSLSVEVASNEPEEGLGDGDLGPDWSIISIDDQSGTVYLQLRAERSGRGEGRLYTITITCTDESGNSSAASLDVVVPHDKRGK